MDVHSIFETIINPVQIILLLNHVDMGFRSSCQDDILVNSHNSLGKLKA